MNYPDKGTKSVMDAQDLEIIRILARKRVMFDLSVSAKATPYGSLEPDPTLSKEEQIEVWIKSSEHFVGGEYAWNKLVGLEQDLTTDAFRHFDNIIPGVGRVDVKTNGMHNGWLGVKDKGWTLETIPELFVLMTGTLPVFVFRGYLASRQLLTYRYWHTINVKVPLWKAEQSEPLLTSPRIALENGNNWKLPLFSRYEGDVFDALSRIRGAAEAAD